MDTYKRSLDAIYYRKKGGISVKKDNSIKLIVKFTDGWEERFVKASYELYLDLKEKGLGLESKKKLEKNA